jgi:hypothetical protein
VYRGFRIDENELQDIRESKQYEFSQGTSFSKEAARAQAYFDSWVKAHRPEKPIAVICTIEDYGGYDTSNQAEPKVEDKVTIPGRARFKLTYIMELPGKTEDGGGTYELKFTGPGDT